ncbi:MAG: carbohydrate ABC transporter permease [Dactylosporangium sp.]|nr:carbohydrate ABC transporter permease [Dactylosporangium sp.]NNJ60647.1 carbohydrate ABC transporter permease [Dactylosporangium sp.]
MTTSPRATTAEAAASATKQTRGLGFSLRRRGAAPPPGRKPGSARPAWEEEPGPIGKLGKSAALVLISLMVVFPLYVVVLTSLSTDGSVSRAGGLVMVPDELSPAAYIQIFSGGVVTRAVLVSLGITVVGVAISLSFTLMAAYGLSRPGSLLHKPLLFMVLLTFLFGPGIIPSYLMVDALGLINSYAALILPTAISAFNLVVLRAFFMNIPVELIDSARMDGAGEFRIFTRIVLPLSKAVTAVVGLFYAVGYWNAFFNAMLYLTDNNKWPLQMVLRTYIVQGQALPVGAGGMPASVSGFAPAPSLALKMAVVVLAVLPALVLYPFVQKHFTKGVIIGAVKG